jgi:fimbrial chaperone protein
MSKKMKAVALATAVAIGTASAAYAYQVSPMIYDLKPVGTGANAVVRVNNTNAQAITVEFVAERRMFDEHGKESRTPADNDFVLFPPQSVIPAGQTQALRVQYIGTPDLKQSVMYNITVKQVPVQLPANATNGVQFVFNFSTVANVVPEGAKAQVEAVSLVPDGKVLHLTLKDNGNKYANLSLSSVTLTGGSYSATIKDDAWRKALGASWILPGGTRVIDLPTPANAPVAGLSASLHFVEVTP